MFGAFNVRALRAQGVCVVALAIGTLLIAAPGSLAEDQQPDATVTMLPPRAHYAQAA